MSLNGNSTNLFPGIKDLVAYTDAEKAVEAIEEIYNKNSTLIGEAFNRLLEGEEVSESLLAEATYPYVGIHITPKDLNLDARWSYGVVVEAGIYGGTVTRPDIFKRYFMDQISLLIERHKVPIYIGASNWSIPLPFAMDHTPAQLDPRALDMGQLWQMQTGFALPNLTRVNDDIANCTYRPGSNGIKPVSMFSGERVDYSLHRLHHYTGTSPDHFQGFVLLTNYQRYVDEFVAFGMEQLKTSKDYESLVIPGDAIYHHGNDAVILPKNLPQMPAYHLKRKDGMGITFINIGVGPTNAKTITDHLAVLRPHCWLMLGHCAGLRSTQVLGDYVLAHGYVREDNVLNQDLPTWIPVPPIAEVQVALQHAVENISNHRKMPLKAGMRTGTVVTTDNRNWELRSDELYERFRQSRAIALDMESATVAANGFRFRVPYGTLLCISDKPIHGEIKLRGMANNFYKERVNQHLKIGLEAIRLLHEQGVDQLHSRKLRGFDEPPFR
ncbi:MAG: AMP nucleosidase [Alphaproteobacteria bacterium]|nr:AMP nucleosidase [Alphaproteobacteria bacterium]